MSSITGGPEVTTDIRPFRIEVAEGVGDHLDERLVRWEVVGGVQVGDFPEGVDEGLGWYGGGGLSPCTSGLVDISVVIRGASAGRCSVQSPWTVREGGVAAAVVADLVQDDPSELGLQFGVAAQAVEGVAPVLDLGAAAGEHLVFVECVVGGVRHGASPPTGRLRPALVDRKKIIDIGPGDEVDPGVTE